jgi:hypothetical protein
MAAIGASRNTSTRAQYVQYANRQGEARRGGTSGVDDAPAREAVVDVVSIAVPYATAIARPPESRCARA